MKRMLTLIMCSSLASLALAQQADPMGSQSSIKQAVLNPRGFDVDWTCGSSRGQSFVAFREDGNKLAVDVNNFSRGNCKTDAKLTESGLVWDGCKDPGIAMSYDAGNKEVPFKGQSSRCSYLFKAK